MILSKAGRLSLLAGLLCLLLMGFTGAANAVIRWDVYPSPTEVINSGRSEVLGSVTMVVQANQPGPILTGNILTGATQIGILLNNRIMIDNAYITTGIKLYTNNVALNSALCTSSCTSPTTQFFLSFVNNIDVTGSGLYAGQITINIPGGIEMFPGDVVRVDGVRGRIDKSDLAQPGTDGYCQLQSINDPAGNQFYPETIRIAKSFIPMTVSVSSDTAVLCLPSYGKANNGYLTLQNITVRENFVRAFVAKDSNGAGADLTDRLDSRQQILGSPTNGTQIRIVLNSIPASVQSVVWDSPVAGTAGGYFVATSSTNYLPVAAGQPPTGYAYMVYEYFTTNQAASSDANLESFIFQPKLALSTVNQQDVGTVRAGVSLWPPPATNEPTSGLYQPYTSSSTTNSISPALSPTATGSPAMPRFVTNYISGSYSDPNPTGTTATTQFGIYEYFSQCVCYLLYPYTTKDSFWDTGLVVANTSEDAGAIPTLLGAAKQAGPVTFWLYDYLRGNITPTAGVYFSDAAHTAPIGQTGPAFDSMGQPIYYAGQSVRGLVSQLVTGTVATNLGRSDFAGYIIAKANFQFCHGYAFVADRTFSNIAQGYVAGVIPDPAVKANGARRTATAAADVLGLVIAGESINN